MKSAFWIGMLLTITTTLACESAAEEQAKEAERLEKEAAQRIAEYVSVMQKNCQDRVLTEAVRIADSILLVEARLSTDTLLKPFKPTRPDKPETQILQDTTPVKPFLKPKRDTSQTPTAKKQLN